jgi:cyclopropane fatty-acyl-phospholipid synthase-like methyltransferase
MSGRDAEAVRRYYDRHTPAFVSFGQRGNDGAIHRTVWGPGTITSQQAFRYVEDRLAELIQDLPPSHGASHVVDLGCGVGASLCYLAGKLPVSGTGITLSPVQVRLAERRIHDAGLSDRIRCVEGDYCDLPGDIGAADLAYAIESFVHGSDPSRFFAQCARLVRPGGLLAICDDFRRPAAETAAAGTIERFRRGWHVNTLLERAEVRSLARAAGFEHESTVDLTPHLELHRLRDRIGDVMLRLFGSLPFVAGRFDYLSGGIALQTCLARGWIGYDLALFRRLGR